MRLLRGAVLSVGFGLLALFGLLEVALRRRATAPAAGGHLDAGADLGVRLEQPPVPAAVSRIRTGLGALGVALAGYGVFLVVRTVPWTSCLAIALWLAAAVVLHDAVLVPALSGLRGATRRVGRRLPAASVTVIEGAFVVGGVVSLIAVPEIYAQHLGTLNPSVLPGSYAEALLGTWLVLAVLAVVAVLAVSVRARRAAAPGSA